MKWSLFMFIALSLALSACSSGPTVSLVFDDATLDQYENALPFMQQYGFQGTMYVITQKVGTTHEDESLMTWEQIQELHDAGWEIGAHSATHPNLVELSQEELTKELDQSYNDLTFRGYEPVGFAVPYGKYDDRVRNNAAIYFDYVRPSEWGVNNKQNFDIYALKSQWVTNQITILEIQDWIDELGEDDWLIIMFHIIDDDNPKEYATDVVVFEETLAYLDAQNIRVRTIRDVLE